MTASKIEHALRYASWGWHVFPLHYMLDGRCSCSKERCKQAAKHPLTPRGFLDASKDPAQIEAWWRRWPDANIGIATGASGLVVLDLDGEVGKATWRTLVEKHGAPPETLVATTGRPNGYHLYYLGNDIPQSNNEAGKLDVRGTSGYVIAPGSVHANGTVYGWANRLMPQRRADWFLEALGAQPKAPDVSLPPHLKPHIDEDDLTGRLEWTLERQGWSPEEDARLRSALAAIPPHIDGKTWHNICRAGHDLYWIVDGRDKALDAIDYWSSKSTGRGDGLGLYKGRADIERRWSKFGSNYKGKRFTIASVYDLAKKHGWDPSRPILAPVEVQEVNGTNGVHALPAHFHEETKSNIWVDHDKAGHPKPTCRNARLAIGRLGLTCEHDVFHDKLRLGGQAIGQWAGEVTDNAVHILRVIIAQQYRFDPGTQNAYDAAVQECLQNPYDPVRHYLDGLKWDGRVRLGTWLSAYMGAEDTPLNRAVGALTLIAAVRRAREPGCKFDTVTVLISDEGRGKSQAIELLAGEDNFSDQMILSLDERAQQEALQGVWIYEIADLAGWGRAEDDRVKATLSRRIDRARPAYARARLDRPRRCIFIGTTNHSTFLRSPTGNRRFWPVQTGRVALDLIARDRDQLWAEAGAIEATRLPIALPEQLWGVARAVQEGREDRDPWQDALADMESLQCVKEAQSPDWPDAMELRINSRDVLDLVLKLPIERQTSVTAKRVAYLLRKLGWEGPRLLRTGDEVAKGWRKLVV